MIFKKVRLAGSWLPVAAYLLIMKFYHEFLMNNYNGKADIDNCPICFDITGNNFASDNKVNILPTVWKAEE